MSHVVNQTYDRALDFDRVNFLLVDVEDFLSKHLYVDDFLVAERENQKSMLSSSFIKKISFDRSYLSGNRMNTQ